MLDQKQSIRRAIIRSATILSQRVDKRREIRRIQFLETAGSKPSRIATSYRLVWPILNNEDQSVFHPSALSLARTSTASSLLSNLTGFSSCCQGSPPAPACLPDGSEACRQPSGCPPASRRSTWRQNFPDGHVVGYAFDGAQRTGFALAYDVQHLGDDVLKVFTQEVRPAKLPDSPGLKLRSTGGTALPCSWC